MSRAAGPPIPLRYLGIGILALAMATVNLPTRAADPLPYQTTLAPSGDAALDKVLHDTSTLVALQTKAPVGPFALVARARDDAGRLLTALHSYGFYAATVTVTVDQHPIDDPGLIDMLEQAPANPPAQVAIRFTLGPLFHLGTIAVHGELPPGMADSLTIHSGDPARADAVLAAGAALLTKLRDSGYALARVDPPVAILHPATQTLDITFDAHAGPRVDLGPISISGLEHVNASYVENRLTLHQGDQFDPQKIEAARQDLASLGVFSEVRADPATTLDPRGQLPLQFVVAERPRHAVDLGISYSTDLGITPSVAWHHRNLFGNGEQLNLTASASDGGSADTALSYKVGAQFIKPDFLKPDQSLQIEVDAVRQDLLAYNQDGLLESAIISRKLSPHWTASAGLSGEQEYIVQESVGRSYNLVGVPLGLKFDNTNNLLEPSKGIRAALTVTPEHSLSVGGATFTIMQISGSTYFNLSGNGHSVLALRGLIGEVTGADQFALPPDQRFYAGGSQTVRGYRYQTVGPLFADGKPQGGTAISAASFELRQRIYGNWGMAAFVDAGQVSANGVPFSQNWQIGTGLGVRYYTSIGPIRVDIAVPMNRPPGGDSFELYIGLGEAF